MNIILWAIVIFIASVYGGYKITFTFIPWIRIQNRKYQLWKAEHLIRRIIRKQGDPEIIETMQRLIEGLQEERKKIN